MVQTLPNYSSLSTPRRRRSCSFASSASRSLRRSARTSARSSGVSGSGSCLGCFAALARASRLASRASLNWFLRRLLISRPFRRSNRGPCALSHGRPSSPSPRNLGYGISYAGAWPPCPCSRCHISSWPLRCSFRLVCFHQRLCSVVVLLRPRPERPSEAREVVLPGEAVCFPPAGVIPAGALLPRLARLFWVLLARAALYHGVEFLFDHRAACYVHLSSLPVMAHGVVCPRGPRCVATIATVATLRSISGI